MNKLYLLLLITACSSIMGGEESDTCNECQIDIYAVYQHFNALTLDENGFYHFNYSNDTENHPSDYGTVYYTTTEPMTRVGWYSPDSFFVEFMGQVIGQPVIQYSTYSGDDADSQQLFYVNPTLIGDTLDIYGYYFNDSLIIDSVKVIIDN